VKPLPLDPVGTEVDVQSAGAVRPLDPVGAEVDAPAQPVPEPAAAPEPPPDVDARIRSLFQLGLQIAPSEMAGANYLARELDLPPALVAQQYPLFQKAAEASQFDPARFRRENPGLVELLLENPRSGIHPKQAEQIAGVTRALRAYAIASDYADSFDHIPFGSPEEMRGAAFEQAIEREKSGAPLPTAPDPWPALKQVPTKVSPLKGTHGVGSTVAIATEEGKRGLLQTELGDVGYALLVAHQLGENQEVLRRRQLELEQELGVQVDYGQNAVEQLMIDAEQAVMSQAATLKEGGKGYGVGLAVGALAGLGATRNPAQALKYGHRVGLIFGKVGFSYGSFKQEAGSTFAQLLDEKMDDGSPVDRDVAAGIAFLYGVAASAVEVASFGELAKSLGPLKTMIEQGQGRAALRAWAADRSKREILKGIGKQWAKSAASEAIEEGTQTTLQYAITWGGKSLAAGAPQKFDEEAFATELGQSIYLGGLGGGAMATPGTVGHAAARVRALDASRGRGELVAEIAKLAGTEAALGAPRAVAHLVAKEARRAGAGDIKAAYLDLEAAEQFFQTQGTDAATALSELLGEDVSAKVAAARAGENLGRLEIPLATYLEKLGPTGVAEALAGDTAVRPFDATLNEQAKLQQDLVAEAEDAVQLWQKTGKAPDPEPGEIEWAKDIARRATESGAATKGDAKRFEQVARAFVRALVKRYGEPARALMSRYVVDVRPAEKMPPLRVGQAEVPQDEGAPPKVARELELELTAAEAEHAAAFEASMAAPAGTPNERLAAAEARLANARAAVNVAREAAKPPPPPLGEEEALNASQDGKEQGWTRFYRVARKGLRQLFQVATTKDQDPSTLLHEFAHVALEVFGDLAETEGAPASAKEEYSRILEWLGVTSRAEITQEHHEKFAGAFETYLYEGKPPSLRLAGVFAKMRAWFLRLGRQLKGAGVPLNDEIRGLFDRMLATDEEIAAVREQYSAGAAADIFPSPEAAGLTPEAYQEYLAAKERAFEDTRIRVQQRLLAEQQAANEGAIRAARKTAKTKAEEEYSALRESRVLRFLRDGDAFGNPALRAMLEAAREQESREATKVEIPEELATQLAELDRQEAELRESGGARRVLVVVRGEFQVAGTDDGRGAPLNQAPLFNVEVRPYDRDRLAKNEQLRAVTIPAWMGPVEYAIDREAWEWAWAAGRRTLPQAEQRWLHDLVRKGQLVRAWAAGRILARGNRTEYQEKVAQQIQAWLAQAASARTHDSPLSPRQWEILTDSRSRQRFRRWEIATKRQVKDSVSGLGEAVDRDEAADVAVALREEGDPTEALYEEIAAARAALDEQVREARLAQQRGRVKLDLQAVVDAVGVEAAERAFRGLTRPDGGMTPDELAEPFGFATGEELLRAVAARPERDAWVEDRTEKLVAAEHPTLLAERERLREAVEDAAHATGDLEYFLKQWAIFRSKAGDAGRPPVEAVKRAAEQIVRGKQAGKLNLRLALEAETGAARRAAEAALKGNWRQAAVLTQQQILNHYVYKAMLDARADRDELERMAKTMTPEKYRGQIGRVSPAIRDAIDQVLEAVGLRERVKRDVAPRSLSEAIQAMESFGTSVMLDRELLERLIAQPLLHTELLVEDMRKVRDALKNLRAAALSQQEVIDGDKRTDRDAAVGELEVEAARTTPHLPPAVEDVQKGVAETLSSWGAAADGEILKAETMISWLGGRDTRSAWYRLVLLPLQRAKHREVELLRGPFKAVIEAFEKIPPEVRRRLNEKIDGRSLFPNHRAAQGAKDGDLEAPARRFQLLMMALNAGNASNLQRLLEGRNITQAQLDRALATLSRAELEWVQSVWDACESLWPLSRELEERDAGVAPPKIEARPFIVTLQDGTEVPLRGGYFPAAYVREVTTAGEKQTLNAVADVLSPGYVRPGTPHSHLKTRAEGFTDALSTDPAVIMRHITQVAHDVAFRETLKSVASLVMDPRIQTVLKRRLGAERAPQFLQWLKDIGAMRAAENAAAARGWLRGLRWLKSNAAVGILGYAADVAMGDLANLGVAIAATPLKTWWWARGLAAFAAHPFDSVRWTGKKSGELAFRRERMSQELQAHVDRMTSRSPFKRGFLGAFRRFAFVFMEASDLATSTPIWMGAYHQAAAEGRSEQEAVEFADAVIRKVFPSHSAVDASMMVRRKDGLDLLLMFHGYANVLANVYRDKAHQVHEASGAARKGLKLVEFIGFSIALSTVASVAAELAMGRGPEDEDKDDDLSAEEWQAWFVERLLVGWAYPIPFFGWTVEAAVAAAKGKRPSARVAPMYSGLERLGRTAHRAVTELEKEDLSEKEVIDLLVALGIVTGVPAVRPGRAVQAGIDLYQGEE
jgi:hypothetical protein